MGINRIKECMAFLCPNCDLKKKLETLENLVKNLDAHHFRGDINMEYGVLMEFSEDVKKIIQTTPKLAPIKVPPYNPNSNYKNEDIHGFRKGEG